VERRGQRARVPVFAPSWICAKGTECLGKRVALLADRRKRKVMRHSLVASKFLLHLRILNELPRLWISQTQDQWAKLSARLFAENSSVSKRSEAKKSNNWICLDRPSSRACTHKSGDGASGHMSALPPEADISQAGRQVRFGAKSRRFLLALATMSVS
jgi:hypothetical protein